MTSGLLLIALLFLIQATLYMHARNVVTGAVQDGARVAAAWNGSVAGGVAHAEALVGDGLGGYAGTVRITGAEGNGVVVVVAEGGLRMIVPWITDTMLPLRARVEMEKERFRVTP